jgi:hypothetical protein
VSSEAVVQAGERRSSRIESQRAVAVLAVLIGHVVVFSIVLRDGGALSWSERLLYGAAWASSSSSRSPATCSSGRSRNASWHGGTS